MNTPCHRRRLEILLLLIVLSGPGLPAAPHTAAEWLFDRGGDLEGWQANGHLTGVVVTNSALHCRAVGSDPILELRAPLDFAASPWQFLEVRMKADHDGTAEWFWSNTHEGRYGGFSQAKSTRFQVAGDNQWHTWRVFPFWQAERRIVRLRFDVYDGASFDIESIRVGELAMPPATERADFVFTNGSLAWQWVNSGEMTVGAAGLALKGDSRDSFLLSPPVRFSAEQQSFATVQLATDAGRFATMLFASDSAPGLQRFPFPLEQSPGPHTYNLDLLAAKGWRGRIVALGLQPTDVPGAKSTLRRFTISDAPQGPPELEVKSLAIEEALPRAGRPARLKVVIVNSGAETATNVRCTLALSRGLSLVSNLGPAQVSRLAFDDEAILEWAIGAATPGTNTAALTVSANNADSVRHEVAFRFTTRPTVPAASYVPEPKPVRGPYEVGVYYFPGWNSWSRWHPIEDFPERKPVLGWYREGDPEAADWHIKWAVEHGITFFAYDWYWNHGARQLEHALHDGYFKARYRHLLKFCLLWANHNPPKTSSQEDCLAVTRYWIENYFRRPEHLTIDGKPAVIIFSPHRLTEDLGSAGVKRAFDAMREECRRAGLKGLYLLACVGDAGGARRAAEEGYDAVTAYNWPGLGMSGSGVFAPFATLIDGYRRNWEHIIEQSPIPMLLPVSGGWDSRPWHGVNNLVRFGRTPELFRQHLSDARRFLETHSSINRAGQDRDRRDAPAASRIGDAPRAPLRAVLIEAWNEWGEGSYIEPHQEFGFGYLDAIRKVFTDAPKDHIDLAPADVGLGPYEFSPEPPGRTSWTFEQADEGWASGMNLANLRIANGALEGQTTGNDPAFFGPPVRANAGNWREIGLRMKLTSDDGITFRDSAQIFWKTTRLPESEETSHRFAVIGDGQWHEYRISVADNVRWRGMVTQLRLDPCNRSGVRVEISSLRLVP